MVRRVYSEKKPEFAVRASELKAELSEYLDIKSVENVRVLIRYDVENVSDEIFDKACTSVFSEPPVDYLYLDKFPMDADEKAFSTEYLPGQFDQRADSAVQCVKLLCETEEPVIQSAVTYVFKGTLSDAELEKIAAYCINPVDSRKASEEKPATLEVKFEEPADVKIFDGFVSMPEAELKELYDSLGLAMTYKDFEFIRNYFRDDEKRNPSLTEIRVLDTYWSDHCRHTTFLTEIKDVQIEDGFCHEPIKASYDKYVSTHKELYKNRTDKYVSLMDIALMGMKALKKAGKLEDMEVSDEINACSVIVPVEIDGKEEEWLVFFKNETHNHPTEIEPFGGAATCLGGAIRDPLSGRGYVYQAMRVTGAADPTLPIAETLVGKLPQRKLTTGAAKGYSSYGNQIGLATGLVDEVYHPNYVAKRMEIGAVMGAAPRANVKRLTSDPGDIIILMGGRTGRDGCGGATGSSKAHNVESIHTCGAEVQKGNAPTERKLQRLFRRPEVSSIIKKCNDFGAGGVSVAIGELADGLRVNLDLVPKKYAGLDGTELAISESQERMAVVVAKEDVEKMLGYAAEENLEAVAVAEVTEDPRLVLSWRGKEIVNIKRAFLDTNGAHQETTAVITMPEKKADYFETGASYEASHVKRSIARGSHPAAKATGVKEQWLKALADLNVCSKKGLVEMFDSSIGASTVTMPYGGVYQQTPVQTMIAKLPVLDGKCDTVTMMSYGFDPYLSSWSPYHGAVYAVISSVAKIVAAGGDHTKIRFTFQEYFRKLGNDPKRWGEPMSALLGAFEAQMRLGLPSIGGKDSMSGSFGDIDVPPTLVSFAVDIAKSGEVVTGELKEAGNTLIYIPVKKDEYELPVYDEFAKTMSLITKLSNKGAFKSMYAVCGKGICEAVSKMSFGNKLGVKLNDELEEKTVFGPGYGSIVAEVKNETVESLKAAGLEFTVIGATTDKQAFEYKGETVDISSAMTAYTDTLEKVFPTKSVGKDEPKAENVLFDAKKIFVAKNKIAAPKVFFPVFPGTNCEYDTSKAFKEAGAEVQTIVFRNRNEQDIRESVAAFEQAIKESQILMFSGGFSAGDEPDGSGKFIANIFRNERLSVAVNDLLKQRDGLVLGVCNGFQAVIKLGLVPYGEIRPQEEDSPTLTTNRIGRHISKTVYTKVVSNNSPWLTKCGLGDVYAIPASHGEGRFVANTEWLEKLAKNGQIATQYVDLNGNATMDDDFNPNGSYMAIEGITDPSGRVLGKMAHTERIGAGVAQNIYGNQYEPIVASGVEYFK